MIRNIIQCNKTNNNTIQQNKQNYTTEHDISNYPIPYHNTTEYITLQYNII